VLAQQFLSLPERFCGGQIPGFRLVQAGDPGEELVSGRGCEPGVGHRGGRAARDVWQSCPRPGLVQALMDPSQDGAGVACLAGG